jgi:nucleoside-diphosphate-sugar epimerase
MRILFAGATGVIGQRVLPQLLIAGHEVTAVARFAHTQAELYRIGVASTTASLFDPDALRAAAQGHDTVINLATAVPPASKALRARAWRETDRIRRDGVANLTAAARAAGARLFIQESFAPIYKARGDAWIDEASPVRPAAYNRHTLDAERSVAEFTSGGGSGIVLRFAYFYGADSEFVRDTIRYARKGWAATLGKADAFVPSVSHDDAADAVVAVLKAPVGSGVYNVVDDEPLRRRAWFDALAGELGVRPPRLPPAWLARVAGPVGETIARSLRISNRKLRESCDWEPRYPSVREGFRAIVKELDRH